MTTVTATDAQVEDVPELSDNALSYTVIEGLMSRSFSIVQYSGDSNEHRARCRYRHKDAAWGCQFKSSPHWQLMATQLAPAGAVGATIVRIVPGGYDCDEL